jgi:hypothetical protein
MGQQVGIGRRRVELRGVALAAQMGRKSAQAFVHEHDFYAACDAGAKQIP